MTPNPLAVWLVLETPVIELQTATSAAAVVTTPEVSYVGSIKKVFQVDVSSLPCSAAEVSGVPSAVVEVARPSATMRLSVWGENHAGAVLRAGGQIYTYCSNFMGPPEGGWPGGKLEIFPLGDLNKKGDHFLVAVDDPAVPARDAAVRELTLDHKLEKPMFLTVTMRKGRAVLPEKLSGSGCGDAAFAGTPDLVVKTSRPIKGLFLRPLAAAQARIEAAGRRRWTRPAAPIGPSPRRSKGCAARCSPPSRPPGCRS